MFWADDSVCAVNGARHARYELAPVWEPTPVVAAPSPLPDGLLVDRRRKHVEQVAPRRWWPVLAVVQPET